MTDDIDIKTADELDAPTLTAPKHRASNDYRKKVLVRANVEKLKEIIEDVSGGEQEPTEYTDVVFVATVDSDESEDMFKYIDMDGDGDKEYFAEYEAMPADTSGLPGAGTRCNKHGPNSIHFDRAKEGLSDDG